MLVRVVVSLIALVAASVTALLATPAPADARTSTDAVGMRRISVVVAATEPSELSRVSAAVVALGGRVRGRVLEDALLVAVPPGDDSVTFSAKLQGQPGVRYATGNATVRAAGSAPPLVQSAWTPNDPYLSQQWGLATIGAPAAWDAARGAGVKIAIIDTGLDMSHPDFVTGRVADATNTVVVGAAARDDNGHGTHVAGIAAATANNGVYVAGAAPDATLLIAKVLNMYGSGTLVGVAQGVDWARERGAQIISLSLEATGLPESNPLRDSVTRAVQAGCLVVAAAGNAGNDTVSYPAAYDGVVGVGATDSLDNRASYSNMGLRANGTPVVTLAAPGSGIVSAYPSYAVRMGSPTYVAAMSGTSMATPFVAGAAAAAWSQRPGQTAAQVLERLTATALDLGLPGVDVAFGHGRIRMDLATVPPAAPTGVSAVASNSYAGGVWSPGVRVTWTDVASTETTYTVWRSVDDGLFAQVASLPKDYTAYNDTLAGLTTSQRWGGRLVYRVSAESPAGSSDSTSSLEVRCDTTAPTVSASVVATYVAPARIGFTAGDDLSGVDAIEFAFDTGPVERVAPGSQATTSAAGSHTISYRAIDVAGNASQWTTSAPFVVDVGLAPFTTAMVNGEEVSDGADSRWVQAAVLALRASEIASTYVSVDGLAPVLYEAPMPLPGDGRHTVRYWSVDPVGNAEATRTIGVRVDGTPPATSASVQPVYYYGATIQLTAVDLLSGWSTTDYELDGTVASGRTVTVAGVGAHTLRWRSTDIAHNVEAWSRAETVTIALPSATGTGIWSSPARPRRRRAMTIDGGVFNGEYGAPVAIYMRRPGSRRWGVLAWVPANQPVPGAMLWSLRYVPRWSGKYYFFAVFPGSAGRFASQSATIVVRVR